MSDMNMCGATNQFIDNGAPCKYLEGHLDADIPHTTANGFWWVDKKDAAQELIDRLAFAMFGGARDIWDRVPAEQEHYRRTAASLLPVVADVWDEGNLSGGKWGTTQTYPVDVDPPSENPYKS